MSFLMPPLLMKLILDMHIFDCTYITDYKWLMHKYDITLDSKIEYAQVIN